MEVLPKAARGHETATESQKPPVAVSRGTEEFTRDSVCLSVTTATSRMDKASGGTRKATTNRAEVIKTLLPHSVADGVLFQGWGLRARDALPGRTGVTLPASGRRLPIDAAVSATVGQSWS